MKKNDKGLTYVFVAMVYYALLSISNYFLGMDAAILSGIALLLSFKTVDDASR